MTETRSTATRKSRNHRHHRNGPSSHVNTQTDIATWIPTNKNRSRLAEELADEAPTADAMKPRALRANQAGATSTSPSCSG